MTETRLVDLLAEQIEAIASKQRVAADVRVTPWDGTNGPFVEVRPDAQSQAPAMSIHVLDEDSVAVAIGDDTSTEVMGSRTSISETVQYFAVAMFRGQLVETVTRDRKGRVLGSKMELTTDGKPRTLWTRSSVTLHGLWGKKRTTRRLDPYPSR